MAGLLTAIVTGFFAQTAAVQLIIIVLVSVGVIKGIIVLPFIPIGNKKFNSVDKALKVWVIKTQTTLYEQMNNVEVAHSNILYKMSEVYGSLTDKGAYIQHYEFMVDKIESKCKGKIRRWLKENHLTVKSETEFTVYVDDNIKYLIKTVSKQLNRYYRNDYFHGITREQVHQANVQALIPYVESIWRKMFSDCREISRANEKLIAKIEGGK